MNEQFLASVTHDTKNNTLEATWLELTDDGYKRVKCHNYSVEQKSEFLADCGQIGEKYTVMAGW